jgi:DNA polymerase-1
MLVGEAPGAEEEATRRPFIGSSGQELDSLLRESGHHRSEFYIANNVKCRPPNNRTPDTKEAAACWPYLAEEIEQVQPKVILCLGGSALKGLTGKDGVAANRGRMVEAKPSIRIGEAKIFVTYHPAAMLHNRNVQEMRRIREAIIQDVKLVFDVAEGRRRKTKDHKKYLLAEPYTAEEMQKGLDALEPCKVLACDLEWTALEDRGMSWPWSRGAELFTIAFSGRKGDEILSFAFSWPPPPDAMEPLRKFFATKPMVFHNALADLNWLEYLHLPCVLAGDTLILSFLMDEQERHGLEQLAPLYTDVEPGWKVGPWATRPYSRELWLEILDYNTNDTYATLKLAEALYVKLSKTSAREQAGIKRIYYNLMLPVVPAMVDMALNGIPMDRDLVDLELQQSNVRMNRITDEIADKIGCNAKQAASLAGSPTQTLKYLKSAYGLEIDSSRKDDLVGYDEDYPIIKLIQQYRWERNKVQGTYLGPWSELLHEQAEPRLHSVYRLTFARTGRTSAEIEKGGSLQLMPRNQDDRELRTRDTVASRPGWHIVAADYSQIELRIAAWFAGERRMIEFFNNNEDLHRMTAAYLVANQSQKMSVPQFLTQRQEWVGRVSKDQRQGAKGVNFGFLYGQQVDGFIAFAKQTYKVDFTQEQGKLARDGYFALYEDLEPWHRKCAEQAINYGYTETPFGRYRRNIEDANQAINTPVQSTASDLALIALRQINRAFKERNLAALLCGFVHDSVICEVRDDCVKEAVEIIKYEMENPNLLPLGVSSLPVPLKADIAIGMSWGTAKEIEGTDFVLTY